ncbi:hypothetical protein AFM11_33495 [Mycolicibacterium wolinskyi]|uniref:Uncharacterized protein n=1 Tax=Mycolicibacterium wolinskyi TaxID=59750 RepID=A0A132PC50_9MYCO|nr:hypothetical protein [Mycolicibacterium wolinskyi]KWX19896.1 hypothetical protein AFM11_33495 [Mycolicibacterium wolinskyi]
MDSNRKRRQFKAVSAGIGLTAAAAMAVLGVLMSQTPAGTQNWSQAPMETGATVTKSTAATEPETSVAKPPFTFTTPEGFAVPH